MNKAITEIRGEDTAELKAKLNDLKKEQFQLRFKGGEAGAKPSRGREVRRTIARIMMVLGERETGGAKVQTATKTETVATPKAGDKPKAATKTKARAKTPAGGGKKQ